MGEVRAFVGHSFTDDDKNVVGKFTDLLDTLQKLNPSFSWVHARAAEPKQLTEKVLALIQDCNLFIAICTKKERVVSTSQPTQLFKRFVLKPDDVQWKTSDWVIQEIGLAIGRNMQLILLIEEGVRKPGGLQGDVEYIPFTREAPEKAFNRIAEMVTALGLNQSPTTGSAVVSNTAPATPAEAEASQTSATLTGTDDQSPFGDPAPMSHYIDFGAARRVALLGEISRNSTGRCASRPQPCKTESQGYRNAVV